MSIPTDTTGRIIEGEYAGRYVRVEPEGNGHFIVITSPKRVFVHGEIHAEVWDDWVEDEAALDEYFARKGWAIDWLD